MHGLLVALNTAIALGCWAGYVTLCYSLCLGVDMLVSKVRNRF